MVTSGGPGIVSAKSLTLLIFIGWIHVKILQPPHNPILRFWISQSPKALFSAYKMPNSNFIHEKI